MIENFEKLSYRTFWGFPVYHINKWIRVNEDVMPFDHVPGIMRVVNISQTRLLRGGYNGRKKRVVVLGLHTFYELRAWFFTGDSRDFLYIKYKALLPLAWMIRLIDCLFGKLVFRPYIYFLMCLKRFGFLDEDEGQIFSIKDFKFKGLKARWELQRQERHWELKNLWARITQPFRFSTWKRMAAKIIPMAYLRPMAELNSFHPAQEDTKCAFCGVDMYGWKWAAGLNHVSGHAYRARTIMAAVVCGCVTTVGIIIFKILFG